MRRGNVRQSLLLEDQESVLVRSLLRQNHRKWTAAPSSFSDPAFCSSFSDPAFSSSIVVVHGCA